MLPARSLVALLCCAAWCLADGAQESVYSGTLMPSAHINSDRVLFMPASPPCGSVLPGFQNYGRQAPGTYIFCTNAVGTNYSSDVRLGGRLMFGPGYRPVVTLLSWWTEATRDVARVYSATSTTTSVNVGSCPRPSSSISCMVATPTAGSIIYLTNTHSGRCFAWPCDNMTGGALAAGPHGAPPGVAGFWGGFAGLGFQPDSSGNYDGIKWQFSAQAAAWAALAPRQTACPARWAQPAQGCCRFRW